MIYYINKYAWVEKIKAYNEFSIIQYNFNQILLTESFPVVKKIGNKRPSYKKRFNASLNRR